MIENRMMEVTFVNNLKNDLETYGLNDHITPEEIPQCVKKIKCTKDAGCGDGSDDVVNEYMSVTVDIIISSSLC